MSYILEREAARGHVAHTARMSSVRSRKYGLAAGGAGGGVSLPAASARFAAPAMSSRPVVVRSPSPGGRRAMTGRP